MMFFLGVLSVFQLILVPGFIIIRWLPGKRSIIQQFVYIFMLSLLANYAAVFALVSVGLYTRLVVLGLFALEVVFLAWLERERLRRLQGGRLTHIKKSAAKSVKEFSQWFEKDALRASLYLISSTLALGAITAVLWIWVSNFNTVFQNWDAWASWDRWAVKWAENRIPGDTWEYPQLIPISYSLAYKFIGTTAIKFFGKSIMPLFTLLIVLMMFDLGRTFRSFGYMLGAVFAYYTIDLFLGQYVADGYVDIPVACFSLMAIYTLLLARGIRDKAELKNTLFLGALATAAAAVTKQTGLYLMVFYPIFAYFWVLVDRKDFKLSESFGLLAKFVGVTLLLVLPWYVLMQYRIVFGGNQSNIEYVINEIYKGQTLPERFIAAVGSLNSYVWYFVFAFASLLMVDNRFKQLLVFVVFPFAILWAFFLSYEHRNLAVALPLLAMTVGVSVEAWIERARQLTRSRSLKRRVQKPSYALLIVGLVLALGVGLVLSDQILTDRQISQQRLIFEPALNQKIYRYFSSHNGPEPVITSYPIGWLPELENTWVQERFQDYVGYEAVLTNHPKATLILVPLTRAHPAILEEIQMNLASGLYQLEFTEGDYILVRTPER
jgi:hypothetical protein